jgi:beta-galactosidase
MWIMRAFGGGAKIVCTYRYRQPLYGGELYHNGLVETDGVTPSSGGKQYVKAAADMVLLRKHFDPNAKEPERYAKRRTGLLYNVDNRWDMDNHKQTERWDSMGHVLKYYSALKRLGCPVDVISEDKEFSKYPFLVAPAYQLLDEALVNRWTKYVQDGGHLILSCRTGQKDRRGQLWEKLWAGPIYDLIGASIPFYDVLPEPITGQMKAGNKPYTWISWGDVLEPAQGTLVLATYADQFYAGKAAAVTRKLGQGSVTYIGVDSLNGTLEADLLKHVFEKAGVAIEFYDDQFIVDWRNGFWIATNFTEKVQWVPFPEEARFLIGSRKLDPAGVAVWKEAAQN